MSDELIAVDIIRKIRDSKYICPRSKSNLMTFLYLAESFPKITYRTEWTFDDTFTTIISIPSRSEYILFYSIHDTDLSGLMDFLKEFQSDLVTVSQNEQLLFDQNYLGIPERFTYIIGKYLTYFKTLFCTEIKIINFTNKPDILKHPIIDISFSKDPMENILFIFQIIFIQIFLILIKNLLKLKISVLMKLYPLIIS